MKTVFRLPQWETLEDVLYFIKNNIGSKGWVVVDDKISSDGYLVVRNSDSSMYVKFYFIFKNNDSELMFCRVGDGWNGNEIQNQKNIIYNESNSFDHCFKFLKRYDCYLVVDNDFIFIGCYCYVYNYATSGDVYGSVFHDYFLYFLCVCKYMTFNNEFCWYINSTALTGYYNYQGIFINNFCFSLFCSLNVYGNPVISNCGLVINDINLIDFGSQYKNLNLIRSSCLDVGDSDYPIYISKKSFIDFSKCQQINEYSFTNILVKPLLYIYNYDLYNNGILYTYPICFLPFYKTSLKTEQRFPHIVTYQTKNYFITPGFSKDHNDAIVFEVDNTSF